jgi:hypothetical protein
MSCLVCKYFQPTEPEDHRRRRESGQCESNCGKEWNQYTAVRYYKNHKRGLQGWCMFYPKPEQKESGHVCAQIDVPDYFYNSHWGLERIEPREHLFEWARKQMTNLVQTSWENRRIRELDETNMELRRQLAAARKVSASRLARLQKQPKPEKPKQLEQPELPQSIVRLVAAE